MQSTRRLELRIIITTDVKRSTSQHVIDPDKYTKFMVSDE